MLPRVGMKNGRPRLLLPVTWRLRLMDWSLWWDQRVLLRVEGKWEHLKKRVRG